MALAPRTGFGGLGTRPLGMGTWDPFADPFFSDFSLTSPFSMTRSMIPTIPTTTTRTADMPYYADYWRPRTDMFEEDNTLVVEFELPGIPLKDISLSVVDDTLTLSSVKPRTDIEKKGTYYMVMI
jgi:HSP20 family molecular chaperone IbpA